MLELDVDRKKVDISTARGVLIVVVACELLA